MGPPKTRLGRTTSVPASLGGEVPENTLRKAAGVGRTPSEAELRVRRSLKNLNLPDWMKGATTPSQGFILRRGSSTDPASTPPWAASSKPWDRGSSSSIAAGSSGGAAGVSNQLSRYASSRSYTLPSPSSATSPSPSAGTAGSGVFHYPSSTVQYPLSRWSLSKISTTGGDQQQGASGSTTPTGSVFSQRSIASYGGRSQPYLGWRSQTSLHIQESSSGVAPSTAAKYLSAAERLALSVSPHKILAKSSSVDPPAAQGGGSVVTAGPPPLSSRPLPHPPPNTRQPTSTHSNGTQPTTRQPISATHTTSNTAPAGSHEDINSTSGSMGCDIHSSIREVTSAIVHYCSERAPSNPPTAGGSRLLPSPASSGGGRPKSPGRRPQLWLESSFVGSRPIDDSPETPGLPPIGSPLAPSMPPPPPPAATPPEPTAASPLLATAGECCDDTPARETSR